MKLASLKIKREEIACIHTPGGYVTLRDINKRFNLNWPADLCSLIKSGRLDELREWFDSLNKETPLLDSLIIAEEEVVFAPPYRHPGKIWGIGLNYRGHALDLDEQAPVAEPASFLKPDTTIIGYRDTVEIPLLSERTTAEAELGIVFKKKCKNIDKKDWQSVIAGYTTIIDMTAEDILRRNPRNLTQSKSFDTFFSFGPVIYTADEIKDVNQLVVSTVKNGKVIARNTVANMTFSPDYLVWYHSRIMTMLPGDLISTGTPGAVHITDGDRVECRITGLKPLINSVKDLKN